MVTDKLCNFAGSFAKMLFLLQNNLKFYEEKLLYVGLPYAVYGSAGNSSGKQRCGLVR